MNLQISRLAILCASLLMACPALSHAAAGRFQFISGAVNVLSSAGQNRIAKKGDEVSQGDTVVTAKAASAQLRMEDGGILAVRQDSRLRIDTFNYNGHEDGSEKGVFSLLQGGFRSITGAIGHTNKENLKIKTSSATIGIRGTDGEIGFNPANGLTGVRTIAGQHAVTAPDAQGIAVTIVTSPGNIVLVTPGQAPAFSKSFPFSSGAQKAPAEKGENSAKKSRAAAASSGDKNDQEDVTTTETTDTATTTAATDTTETTSTTTNADASGTTTTTQTTTDSTATAGGTTILSTSTTSTTTSGMLPSTAPLTGTDPTTGTTATLTTSPPTTAATSVTYGPYGVSYAVPCPNPSFPCAAVASEPRASVNRDASGAPTAFASASPYSGRNITLINPLNATRSQAPSYAVTGIEYGTWQVSAVDWTSTNPAGSGTDTPLSGSLLHWFAAAGIKPDYLTQVLTGTVNYTFDGGTAPTNQNGVAGSVVSAALAANFSSQTVDLSFALSVNAHSWTVSASGRPINHEFFSAPSALVTIDGCTTCGAQGSIDGRFTGIGSNGAAVVYGLGGGSVNEEVNGVLAFVNSSAPNNSATPYRPVGIAGYDLGANPPAVVNGTFNAASRVTTDGSGNLIAFDGQVYISSTTPDKAVRYAAGTATPTDLGQTAYLVWGRWAGGSINVTDRVSGTTTAVTNPGSLHYLAGQELTAPIALPLSGSYTYTFVGGTQPTDNLGSAGTLNSTSLTADFGAMTVNAAVSASVSGTTLSGSATAMPIMPDGVASAGLSSHNTFPLNVTCSGTCGTAQSGNLSVAFTGATGQGAGMLYSLGTSGGTNKIISGAAGFQR